MTDLRFSRNRVQLSHDDAHEGSLTLAVTSHERDLLPSPNLDLRIPEDHLLRISHREVRPLEYHISRSRRRREFYCQCRIVSFIYLDSVEFFQRFYSRLDLIRFGRLIPELIDEILGLLDHLLLILICGHLLLKTFFSKFQVFGIRHFIIMDMSHHNLDRPVGDIIQETSVMGNQQYRTSETLEVILKPLDRLYVQMVGRLVQKQHVRT